MGKIKEIVLAVLVIMILSTAGYWLIIGHQPPKEWFGGSFVGAVAGAFVFRGRFRLEPKKGREG